MQDNIQNPLDMPEKTSSIAGDNQLAVDPQDSGDATSSEKLPEEEKLLIQDNKVKNCINFFFKKKKISYGMHRNALFLSVFIYASVCVFVIHKCRREGEVINGIFILCLYQMRWP